MSIPKPPPRLGCVLFDLDGTLVDTAPDMARALNRLRLECNLSALPFAQIRPVVSHGTAGLLKLGFNVDGQNPRLQPLRRRFLELYAADIATETRLFPGMEAVLNGLEARSTPWGIVTNKPGWLTEALLKALDLWQRSACVVSGDTLAQRKPDPAPLLHASQMIGIEAQRCCYIGDAERDVQAGKRAGMVTLVAGFGYIHSREAPQHWGADGFIASPSELLDWLRRTKVLA